jgi:hypothetical protein
MDDELEKMWKERSRSNLRHNPDIYLEELRKITKSLNQESGLRAEILTRDFPNTKQD